MAVAIGAAFISVWFTKASNLYAKLEKLWEGLCCPLYLLMYILMSARVIGIFSLIASLMIFVMGITMLKMDRAKTVWRIKLQKAFSSGHGDTDREKKSGKWILFILPMITILREGAFCVILAIPIWY